MGDVNRYRYQPRNEANRGGASDPRLAQAAPAAAAPRLTRPAVAAAAPAPAPVQARGRGDGPGDPLAELARIIGDQDPFDDFSDLEPEQATDPRAQRAAPAPAAPRGVSAAQPARQSPAYQSPAYPAPASRAAPSYPTAQTRAAPPAPAYDDEPDYDDADDDYDDQPAPAARQYPSYYAQQDQHAPAPAPRAPAPAPVPPAPVARAAQPAPVSGRHAATARTAAPVASSYPAAAQPAAYDERAGAVRTGYGSLARQAAARPQPEPAPASQQSYGSRAQSHVEDDEDEGYDDAGYGTAKSGNAQYSDTRTGNSRYETSKTSSQDDDEAAYAYSAERRYDAQDDYDEYDDYDPNYSGEGYMPPHGEEVYDTEPRRKKGRTALLLAGGVLGLAVAGAFGVFAYNLAMHGSPIASSGSTPPVIRADATPAKTASPAPAASNDPQQKLIYDRVGTAPGAEKVVSREEQPVDVTSAATRSASANSGSANGASAQPANPTEPKRVRTTVVRADNTNFLGPTSSASAYAPTQNPVPGGIPSPNPVATVPVSGTQTASLGDAAGAASGAYVVQVASQRSEADAMGSWRALQARYPNLLGNYRATVKKADLGDKGIYYRAQVGPFATRDQANELCQSLRNQGGDCIVNKN